MDGFKTGTVLFRDHLGQEHEKPPEKGVVWRISAYALIVSGDGIVLVECVLMPGLWMLPGGGIDPDESLSDGLLRECQEELGTMVNIPSSQPRFIEECDFYAQWTDEFTHALAFVFAAEVQPTFIDRLPMTHDDDPEIRRVAIVKLQDLHEEACHPAAWMFLSRLMRR